MYGLLLHKMWVWVNKSKMGIIWMSFKVFREQAGFLYKNSLVELSNYLTLGKSYYNIFIWIYKLFKLENKTEALNLDMKLTQNPLSEVKDVLSVAKNWKKTSIHIFIKIDQLNQVQSKWRVAWQFLKSFLFSHFPCWINVSSESVALHLQGDHFSISVWQDKKNTWQLSHIIREEEPDIFRVYDRKLMRSSLYAVTVLSQLDFEWFSALAGHLLL